MARGKDKPQYVIVDYLIERLVHSLSQPLLLRLKLASDFFMLLSEHLPAPQTVDRAPLRRGHQPWGGIFRNTFFGPPLERRNERVLGQLLRNADIASDAGNRGDKPRGFDLPHRLNRPVDSAHLRLTPS
jgi:hypothetical protein